MPPPKEDERPGLRPHEHRDVAESFGVDPAGYDRARPRYPEELVAQLVTGLPGLDVLDVGCGTGIVARQLLGAGCRLLGVEPDARMADWARASGVEVEVSGFEEWEDRGRRFDAVVAGQAWHWVDPVKGAAKAAGVLRPGGRLAVLWNDAQPPEELAVRFAEVYQRRFPDSLGARHWRSRTKGEWRGYAPLGELAADGMRRAGALGEPQQWRFASGRSYSRAAWLDWVRTTGGHTGLPAEELGSLLADLGEVIDEAGGAFTARCETLAVSADIVAGVTA